MASSFDPKASIPSQAGRVFFITGGNQGIGQHTILGLAAHSPKHIYFTSRSLAKAEDTISKVKSIDEKVGITAVECDLASLASVKKAVKEFTSKSSELDVLILNAGIMNVPPAVTTDGYEIQMGTNHLGHALLAKLLLPTLESTASAKGSSPEAPSSKASLKADPRIIILSSYAAVNSPPISYPVLKTDGRAKTYLGNTTILYSYSKLANVLYARSLAQRYPAIKTVVLHPGIVQTNLVGSQSGLHRGVIRLASTFLGGQKTPEEGAWNSLWAATTPREGLEGGGFYVPVGVRHQGGKAMRDEKAVGELWEWTEKELAAWTKE